MHRNMGVVSLLAVRDKIRSHRLKFPAGFPTLAVSDSPDSHALNIGALKSDWAAGKI